MVLELFVAILRCTVLHEALHLPAIPESASAQDTQPSLLRYGWVGFGMDMLGCLQWHIHLHSYIPVLDQP